MFAKTEIYVQKRIQVFSFVVVCKISALCDCNLIQWSNLKGLNFNRNFWNFEFAESVVGKRILISIYSKLSTEII